MAIETIKDLKEAIKDLPDEMLVMGCDAAGQSQTILTWIISEDTLTEEEIEDGYPDGVTPTFAISYD